MEIINILAKFSSNVYNYVFYRASFVILLDGLDDECILSINCDIQ